MLTREEVRMHTLVGGWEIELQKKMFSSHYKAQIVWNSVAFCNFTTLLTEISFPLQKIMNRVRNKMNKMLLLKTSIPTCLSNDIPW
jgi:ABC-type spermidine/putrescine transport system permease subunit I